MDTELVVAVVDSLNELRSRCGLPKSELRKIAIKMIKERKLSDADWALEQLDLAQEHMARRRNLARVRGHMPFTSLSKTVYQKLSKSFGDDVMQLMACHLENPEDVFARWAFRFALAIREIGLEECSRHREHLYHYVTEHDVWKAKTVSFNGKDFRSWLCSD